VAPHASRPAVSTTATWTRLLLELFGVFAMFQWSAAAFGSDRGQAGVFVGAIVVGATLVLQRLRPGQTLASAARAIGLGPPSLVGLLVASGLSAALLLLVPLFARITASTATVEAGSLRLVPGLFAQAGVAEETLFRGYLFGHLREGRSFWGAATLSMLPFVAVHLLLFLTMPWPLALTALALSVAISFPFAHLYELGGATIWAPALLHFVVQGTVKVVVLTGGEPSVFPLMWMAASLVLSMLALQVPRPDPPIGHRR
jgi:membrane protease YdiL (CAAX protease family)